MTNNGAHSSLPTPNSSASSSTGDTPPVPNATFAASNSTNTPPPKYETLTFGTSTEQEEASRPRRDLGQQRDRLRLLRALQQVAAQRAQSQLQATREQPPLPPQHGLQLGFNPTSYTPPQPQAPHHQQAYPPNVPAVPNPNVPGLSRNAPNDIANENAGLGVGYGPPGMPAPMWNAGIPPLPPTTSVPQGTWPAYGHHFPAPYYYAGYPRPHAGGVAPFAAPHHGPPTHAPPAPAAQALPNVAPPPSSMQGHMPQLPENVNHGAPSHDQEVRQAPPVLYPFAGPPYPQQQPQQAQTPQVPPLGQVEGGSTRSSKRKAVYSNDTTQKKQKRHRPEDDPNFERVQPDSDGRPRWKCLKKACANVKPMLENSVHKHVTATNSHQADSPEPLSEHICPSCGTTFKRLDSMTRHSPSNQCAKNKAKSPQAGSVVLGNSAATPSSSGTTPSSVAQQSLPLPVATPDIVQVVGNSTFVAGAPVVMPQQQFTFQARGPAPSSVAQQSGVQATRTEPRSATQPGSSLPVFPQEVSSLPEVQSDIQAAPEPTSEQQQPAVALPSQPIQDDFSTPDQTSIPLPSAPEPRSVQPPSGGPAPIVAGDFSLSIFNQTATSVPPILSPLSLSPSEDVANDSSADLFSAPPSPAPSEDALDFSHLFSAPPSPAPSEDTLGISRLFSAPPSPVPSEDALGISRLFPAPPSPAPSEDALDSLHLFSAPPSPLPAEKAMDAPGPKANAVAPPLTPVDAPIFNITFTN